MYWKSNIHSLMRISCRKDTSKTRAMETHFYTMRFFFLSQECSYEHSERFLPLFFLICASISRIMNAKNLEIREGTHKQWKPTSTQRFWESSKKSEHSSKKSDTVKKAVQGKKSDIAKKIVKNHEKNKFVKFPTKIKENVAFFTVRFFYLALLVALFIPYMVTISTLMNGKNRKHFFNVHFYL